MIYSCLVCNIVLDKAGKQGTEDKFTFRIRSRKGFDHFGQIFKEGCESNRGKKE